MCLSKIHNKITYPEDDTFYKVFKVIDGKLYPEFFDIDFLYGYLVGEWYTAKKCKGPTSYELGFHCFTSKKDAKEYLDIESLNNLVVRKVKVEKIHTQGSQNIGLDRLVDCIVAEKMKIIPTFPEKIKIVFDKFIYYSWKGIKKISKLIKGGKNE